MSLTATISALMLSQGAAAAVPDVAADALIAGQNGRAAERIEASADRQDPALLINLGLAYARQGRADEARALFERAAMASERFDLETAQGAWVDSRRLALKALDALDRGRLSGQSRTAMR